MVVVVGEAFCCAIGIVGRFFAVVQVVGVGGLVGFCVLYGCAVVIGVVAILGGLVFSVGDLVESVAFVIAIGFGALPFGIPDAGYHQWWRLVHCY